MEIYDRLLQFSLFQGMSHADLMEVVGHTKFDFVKLKADQVIVTEGQPCSRIYFIASGTMVADTSTDDRSCRVCETLHAPYALQTERIFGFSQRYSSTFRTLTPCNAITIDKQEVLLLMETQLVFRLNMTNQLAAEAQRLSHRFWRTPPRTLRDRLIRLFFDRCLYPAGSKTFYVLMTLLASELNASRLDVSRILNEMQREQLLTLHRGRIDIPLIERLLM